MSWRRCATRQGAALCAQRWQCQRRHGVPSRVAAQLVPAASTAACLPGRCTLLACPATEFRLLVAAAGQPARQPAQGVPGVGAAAAGDRHRGGHRNLQLQRPAGMGAGRVSVRQRSAPAGRGRSPVGGAAAQRSARLCSTAPHGARGASNPAPAPLCVCRPAVVISYAVSGLAALFAAVIYGEFATVRSEGAGSAAGGTAGRRPRCGGQQTHGMSSIRAAPPGLTRPHSFSLSLSLWARRPCLYPTSFHCCPLEAYHGGLGFGFGDPGRK